MKMKLRLLVLSSILFSNVHAQLAVDPGKTQHNEPTGFCGEHTKLNQLAQTHPDLYAQYLSERSKETETAPSSEKSGVVYTFPVVVHVLHQNGPENISMEQIKSAIDVLNVDYRRLNPDADLVHPDFIGLPADVEFQFALATKAPNGDCFSGVTRTATPLTFDGSNGEAQVSAVIAGNDVYQGQWPPNRYINIYVCDDIGGAGLLGYTFKPASWSGSSMYFNGIFVNKDHFGDTGTSSVDNSRTLTHELGHWFNLSHPWGDNNDPGVSCGNDNVSDTPITRGSFSCNLNENFCGPRANVENYMDYASCSKMFTPGQATRMRNAAQSSTAGRNNLWTASNLNLTGVSSPTLCKAQFNSDKQTVCSGGTVSFEDESYSVVSSWSWSFPGGSPSTSTIQNPTVTYATPGVYPVVLTASDGTTSNTETKANYITVLDFSANIPYADGFETYSTLSGINEWVINNPGNNGTWELTTSAGHTGTKSAKLVNFNQPAGNIDELIGRRVNIAGQATSNTTFTFRYAYRKRVSTNNEILRVFFSNDCGETWQAKKTLAGSILSPTAVNSDWTPTSADWATVHVINFTNANMVNDFRYKFNFESDGGNNLYIDNINIYPGAPSESIVVGVENNELIEDYAIYPNPASDDVNITFNVANNNTYELVTQDVTGKIISRQHINAVAGDNIVMMDVNQLAKGIYFIKLSSNGVSKTLQFIKN